MSEDLIGAYDVQRLSLRRLMTMDGLEAATPGHRTYGLVELDVTLAKSRVDAMRRQGQRVSLFAFAVACIAKALYEHRELNAVRSGRKVFRFEDVDVSLAIEVETPEGPFPYQLALRRAHTKSAEQIYAEIEAVRSGRSTSRAVGRESQRFETAMKWLVWLPRFVRIGLLRLTTRFPLLVKRWSGTTFITSVGKFAHAPGFVIPYAAGPMAATFALGSVVDKPVLRGEALSNHAFLAMTVIVNHDLVDGGPAARFVGRLQALIESAEGLPHDPDLEPPA